MLTCSQQLTSKKYGAGQITLLEKGIKKRVVVLPASVFQKLSNLRKPDANEFGVRAATERKILLKID